MTTIYLCGPINGRTDADEIRTAIQSGRLRVDRGSPAYGRATAAGFTFGEPYTSDDVGSDRRHVVFFRVPFRCVCGTEELFMGSLNPLWVSPTGEADIVQLIENHGSFSREHLEADGFTREQIERIRRPYETPYVPPEMNHHLLQWFGRLHERTAADGELARRLRDLAMASRR